MCDWRKSKEIIRQIILNHLLPIGAILAGLFVLFYLLMYNIENIGDMLRVLSGKK